MHDNAALITKFYEAFQSGDGDAMAACYTPDASFADPVFPDLEGPRAGNMWRMLTSQATDLKVEFSGVQADDNKGTAHWEAWYTFSATGRMVHNIIDAEFTFKDGLIATHRDTFDLHRWTKLALGMPGILLGWSSFLQNKIRGQAGKALSIWESKNAG
jgi:ketosteroid isomerase-like protein